MKYIRTFESFSYLEEDKVNEGFLGNLMYKIKSLFKGKSMLGKELKAEFDRYNIPSRFEEIFESEKDPKIDELYKKVASGGQLTKEDAKLISNPIDLLLLTGYRLNSGGKFSILSGDGETLENRGNQLLQLFGFDSSKYTNRQELAVAKAKFISGILVPNVFEDNLSKFPGKTYFVGDLEVDFSEEIPTFNKKNMEYYSILLGDFVPYKEDSSEIFELTSKIDSGVSMSGVLSAKDKEEGVVLPKFSTIPLHQFLEKFQTNSTYKEDIETYSKALDEGKPELVKGESLW